MTPLLFYLGSLGLLALGALCLINTSLHSQVGGDVYDSRRKRRLFGKTLMVAAALSMAIGLIGQFSSRNPSLANSPRASASFGPSTGSTINSSPRSVPGKPPVPDPALLLRQAEALMRQNQPDAALANATASIMAESKNPAAYALRGDIYASKKLWDQAEADFQTVLQMDSASVPIKFNLAELKFAQKKYDAARARYAPLQQDPDYGDLAQYKVFLCDLLGGHDDAAARELAAFNQVGSNASYYFANAAWSLVHQKKDDARGWLTSAGHIYAPAKFKLYADSLIGISPPAGSKEQSRSGPGP